jgi:hypothetical protein
LYAAKLASTKLIETKLLLAVSKDNVETENPIRAKIKKILQTTPKPYKELAKMPLKY